MRLPLPRWWTLRQTTGHDFMACLAGGEYYLVAYTGLGRDLEMHTTREDLEALAAQLADLLDDTEPHPDRPGVHRVRPELREETR
jgi:hypothetical protein